MKTIDVPFNRHLDIKMANDHAEYLLTMDAKPNHLNHLGTIHASALFSLAEASGGEFLLQSFGDISHQVIPVVRKAEVRFRRPARGRIKSKAGFSGQEKEEVLDELLNNDRAFINVKADLYDEDDTMVFSSIFEWYIQRTA